MRGDFHFIGTRPRNWRTALGLLLTVQDVPTLKSHCTGTLDYAQILLLYIRSYIYIHFCPMYPDNLLIIRRASRFNCCFIQGHLDFSVNLYRVEQTTVAQIHVRTNHQMFCLLQLWAENGTFCSIVNIIFNSG